MESYTEATYAAAERFNRGDYQGAIARLNEMARVNPDNIKVHEVLADAYLRTGQIDLASAEMDAIRDIAARLYPHLKLDGHKTFEELAAEADASEDLESRYQKLLDSGSVAEMLREIEVASQLSVKLMAAQEYRKAEQVVARYAERLDALRKRSRGDAGYRLTH
jgi:tetratricopeptide (TPR) repeat protein